MASTARHIDSYLQSVMANNVVHFAIHADDVERARRFYESVFGWRGSKPGGRPASMTSSPAMPIIPASTARCSNEKNRDGDVKLHLWTFGGAGKVFALRHYVDTSKHIAAWKL